MAGPFSLEGRKAMVTGANTGIGRAIATSIAGQGAEVVCAGRRSCAETVAAIIDAGGTASELQLDFSDPMAAHDIFAGAGFDLLVNNAGTIRREDSVNLSETDWDEVMDVNLKAVFFTCQAFGKELLSQQAPGAVVNVASLLSFQGGIRVASYTASKHGVAGITKILANEWAPHGITVNAIAPGYIATNNTVALRADPERSKAILDRIPAGRWGDPEDIGGTAAYLCSPAARYVTGAVLNVDGGWLAR
ncbi:2-dehydro-3-deoxy-D-gluconate 5-dehydrogenase KduD [Pelagovum pacificum]|uniref:2-dehydro-3-deoxy-D-gluconate 5-dehydrogenase KduD n=1 Tax=Pelagovum pacificum TaxID=2588711 RepID=A0A5C5GHW4_9RHOB|nr:2-dehydro-3-deoxy-D-gluconate 5-dehydrogenase KduD [Pelagovum pacificum]QQA43390.1 2-dehydro-3-deoxy-D-gluconate 5-dehydrogenase KduD [Pelagovum pacificum]TNY33471.1 2-dehydro-3-deoxy-D-gluconate 5-dehydrogenase KduD [Pelagovum pacificum]